MSKKTVENSSETLTGFVATSLTLGEAMGKQMKSKRNNKVQDPENQPKKVVKKQPKKVKKQAMKVVKTQAMRKVLKKPANKLNAGTQACEHIGGACALYSTEAGPCSCK